MRGGVALYTWPVGRVMKVVKAATCTQGGVTLCTWPGGHVLKLAKAATYTRGEGSRYVLEEASKICYINTRGGVALYTWTVECGTKLVNAATYTQGERLHYIYESWDKTNMNKICYITVWDLIYGICITPPNTYVDPMLIQPFQRRDRLQKSIPALKEWNIYNRRRPIT